MRDLTKWFFAAGALSALIGMAWGIQMSATNDHTLSPAHGHLNLIGFVTLTIYGIYYALTPGAAKSKLAPIHLGISVLAVIILVPGIAMAISGAGETLAKVGSIVTIATMGLFIFMILRHGVGVKQ
ncbi:hypothetical protein [Maritalea mediterranea]|uniref:Uncharacterized protein n=1 Tax=Maritalea mediterranea TaxID=2909667 RepID=A0ABS9E8B1_9HYPH|nr:hypothetical protein [Maritalea mediterranea]MCF4098424.1 hypothetical protein [Maritalea mediterranea]